MRAAADRTHRRARRDEPSRCAGGRRRRREEPSAAEELAGEPSCRAKPRTRAGGRRRPGELELERRESVRAALPRPRPHPRRTSSNNYWHRADRGAGRRPGPRQRLLARLRRARPRRSRSSRPHFAEAGRQLHRDDARARGARPAVRGRRARDRDARAPPDARPRRARCCWSTRTLRGGASRRPTSPLLLVSQNFFRLDDRYRFDEATSALDKLRHRRVPRRRAPTAARSSSTNPTSTPRRLELLLQIPQGALPVQRRLLHARRRRSQLGAVRDARPRVLLLLPGAGQLRALPGARRRATGELVALRRAGHAERRARAEQRRHDLLGARLAERHARGGARLPRAAPTCSASTSTSIAWRMRDRAFFDARDRRCCAGGTPTTHVLWSYGILHHDDAVDRARVPAARRTASSAQCGRCARLAAGHDRSGRAARLPARRVRAAVQRRAPTASAGGARSSNREPGQPVPRAARHPGLPAAARRRRTG